MIYRSISISTQYTCTIPDKANNVKNIKMKLFVRSLYSIDKFKTKLRDR